MKNLSLINNNWIERIDPNITAEEKVILEDSTIPPSETKKILIENIKARSFKAAEPNDTTVAQIIYDQYKIVDSDLISADISLPDGHGIINCRVSSEHKQIRF